MIFGNRKIDNSITMTINNNMVEQGNEVKCLGVVLDIKFKWKPLLKYINKKFCISTGLLKKVK